LYLLWSIVFLLGDTVHAGGFAFGQSTRKEYMNQVFTYISAIEVCSDDKTIQDAINGKNYNYHAPEIVQEPGLLAIMQH